MFPADRRLQVAASICVLVAAVDGLAQQTLPPQTPPPSVKSEEQEPVKVFTEEVVLPIAAFDEHGRFDPTLEPDDILVLEDNVPQRVRSVRHLPANILLLFDMGSQVVETRSTNMTREIALEIVARLRPNDQIAIVQNSNRVELLEDWTTDRERVAHVLKTKYFSSNRSRLSQCLIAAADKLKEKPAGSTHVIIFTDGIEPSSNRINYEEEALKRIVATQATVHVITYSALSRQALKKRHFGLDFEMRRWFKNYGEATKQNDQRLARLVEEMGGRLRLPASLEEAAKLGDEVVSEIGAQYVVTYTPKRPFASAGERERRSINVFSRRVGLQLLAMRSYVATPAP